MKNLIAAICLLTTCLPGLAMAQAQAPANRIAKNTAVQRSTSLRMSTMVMTSESSVGLGSIEEEFTQQELNDLYNRILNRAR